MWGAVAVGLVGSVAVALDGLPLGGDLLGSLMEGGSDEAQGTLLMLGSCLFYSLSVVRLSMYAPKFCSVDLTAVKKCTLGAASLVWLYSTLQDRFQGAWGEGGKVQGTAPSAAGSQVVGASAAAAAHAHCSTLFPVSPWDTPPHF